MTGIIEGSEDDLIDEKDARRRRSHEDQLRSVSSTGGAEHVNEAKRASVGMTYVERGA
jgi:hypothetical protein